MKFIQFYEYFESNSYITYTVAYKEDRLNEDEFTSYFLNIKPNIRLSLSKEYRNEKTILVTPRTDTLPSWSSICKNIFVKAGFTIEIVLKTRSYISLNDAGMGELTERYDLYDRMTEAIFEINTNETEYEPVEFEIIRNMINQPLYNLDTRIQNMNTEERIAYNKSLILKLDEIDVTHGLSLSEEDKQFIRKNGDKWEDFMLTIYDIAQSNSEHCRHHFFNGTMSFENEDPKPSTLFDLVKEPYKHAQRRENKDTFENNSRIAFCDNSSSIKGFPTQATTVNQETHKYTIEETNMNFVCTAETHNFPTAISPFPGAATGIGGRIRDVQATGRGAQPVCSSAGYCVGKLFLNETDITNEYPSNMVEPTKILIEASNGASDYGNKFGEPIVNGFTRSFRANIGGERREWVKPIMFTGGLGIMQDKHTTKKDPRKDMVICKIGGPVYKIGLGGSTASSRVSDDKNTELDFSAVQRADPQMEQKMNKVIRSCIEMGDGNPILSIHDQGAGGNGNVLKELIDGLGATLNLDNLEYGTRNISIIETWLSEYQESNAILISETSINLLEMLCYREGVSLSVLGYITGDGRLTINCQDGEYEASLNYEKEYKENPPRKYQLTRHPPIINNPLPEYDKNNTTQLLSGESDISKIFNIILENIDVGSKRFLTNKVDRSVTGLIAQQQCVGPLHTPLADYCLYTTSHFPDEMGRFSGCASAIGERPYYQFSEGKDSIEMMVCKTVEEMLFNLVWVGISDLRNIRVSANWMWPNPTKDPYQANLMYRAMECLSKTCCHLGIAIDGGKDSLSMVANHKSDVIKSPGSLVLTGYASVPNIYLKTTPDLKPAFKQSTILLIQNIANQEAGPTDMIENTKLIFESIQQLIKGGMKILAGHDCSDGGFLSCILEMAFAGNTGVCINIPHYVKEEDANMFMIREMSGVVIQVLNQDLPQVIPHLTKLHQNKHNPNCAIQVDPVAIPLWYDKVIIQKGIKVTEANKHNGPQKKVYFTQDMTYLRNKWESGSRKLELLQCNPKCVKQEYDLYGEFDTFHDFTYKLPFCGLTPDNEIEQKIKANLSRKIGIIRGEGSNSERELAAAFKHAGFQVYDLNMNDLIQDDHFLDNMNGIAFAGGFTFSDVLGAGTGWYSMIHYNQSLKEQFQRFYEREDSFSIGICNGCQLMAKLGWIDGVKDLELVENESQRFESRWSTVRVNKTNNIFLKSLAGLRFGIWVAHKEGQFKYNIKTVQNTSEKNTTETHSYEPVIQYIDSDCQPTQHYPENPNGSFKATAALSSKNGRHLAIMPHPERSFLMYQVPFTMLGSDGMLRKPTAAADHDIFYSPWFQMFLNL
jgi:phosphoribosylformylglycinamidine synthase